MGDDKGALEYHGRPQALWAYSLLQGVCEEVFLSLRAEQRYPWLPEGRVIEDVYHNLGPGAGLLSAARAWPQAAWLLLACDMPLIDLATLEGLVRGRQPDTAALAYRHSDGTPEPLCAIYQPPACRMLQARVQANQGASLRALLEDAPTRWCKPPDASRLANANDPEQRAALGARLGAAVDTASTG